jgi:hypothetical protein
LGTPLLLPLTISLDYDQQTKLKEPTVRSLAISIEPISILFSDEDVKLLRAVVDAWTLSKSDDETLDVFQKRFYKVMFPFERLGLGLKKERGQIIVDNIADLRIRESIEIGDSLFAINGAEIVDAATISLSEMVSRLSSAPRPLIVTFSSQTRNHMANNPVESFRRSATNDLGTIDKINVSIASAAITVVEKEVPLIKACISMTKVACNVMRSKASAIRLEASSNTSIDYFNLRIWGWEPFVDPGVFYLSSSFRDDYHGPRELSIEIGDREAGFSINITDSFMETINKFLDWRKTGQGNENDNLSYLYDNSNHGINSSTSAKRNVAYVNATNAAFRFAARQKIGMTKPFEFRNRSGVSVAFARQKGFQNVFRSTEPPTTVGEYDGLAHYDSSEITVLSNGEDLKFRIDVHSVSNECNGYGHVGRFPSFDVALQRTAGVVVEPFENLETSRLGEILLPLFFATNLTDECLATPHVRKWASWLVEQLEEKTVVTIGSSIRVVSMLTRPIEIGIAVRSDQNSSLTPNNVMPLGILREGISFNMPLWIAMQKQSCRCYLRLGAEFIFTPIFNISPEGSINLQTLVNGCIECRHTNGITASTWIAVSLHDDGGLQMVSIDCLVSIRNLLPISLQWEVVQGDEADGVLIDGSLLRSQPLRSGEEVEILTNNFRTAKVRFCPSKGDFMWSSWTSLLIKGKPPAVEFSMDDNDNIQEDCYTTIYVKDAFHVNIPFGIRIASKASGIDVTVYADIWCTNCTSLDILFGSTIFYEQNRQEERLKELSVGEATLREISSLFENGEFVRRFDSSPRDNVNDIIRIPGQVCSHITEECFEYVEVEGNTFKSRWWASENPFSTREYLMGVETEQCNWIDKSWVSFVN